MSDKKLTMHCANCFFSAPMEVLQPDGTPIIGKTQLVCMHSPPQQITMQVPTNQGIQVSIRSQFPAVSEAMCCHQHEFDPDEADEVGDTDLITGEPLN